MPSVLHLKAYMIRYNAQDDCDETTGISIK